jgi:hypothetical protein
VHVAVPKPPPRAAKAAPKPSPAPEPPRGGFRLRRRASFAGSGPRPRGAARPAAIRLEDYVPPALGESAAKSAPDADTVVRRAATARLVLDLANRDRRQLDRSVEAIAMLSKRLERMLDEIERRDNGRGEILVGYPIGAETPLREAVAHLRKRSGWTG